METTTRNANLEDLANMLQEQHTRKLDVVVPATGIRSVAGTLFIDGTEVVPDAEAGFKTTAGAFVPTAICDEGIAEKLRIPVAYLKNMRLNRPDLYDGNVNGWLHGRQRVSAAGEKTVVYPADERRFLVRNFSSEDGPGIARAFLSDGYKIIDNLDVMVAALEGARQSGAQTEIESCDLTERRMYIRITAPEITAMAPELLKGYRSPFNGDQGIQRAGNRFVAETNDERPIVFAGLVISNSETGGGAFTIVPRITVQVCTNGMTITKDASRAVHLGSKMDEGIIKWSDDTQEKNLELIAAKTRDAVKTFLSPEYLEERVAEIEAMASAPIEKPDRTIKLIGSQLRYSEDRIAGVLDHFIRGGQMTAAGVMNAVTSLAQTIGDADEANELENTAMRAFELAAR